MLPKTIDFKRGGKHFGRRAKKVRNSREKIHQNYDFTFTFNSEDGPCQVTMTSVAGHITGLDFGLPFRGEIVFPGDYLKQTSRPLSPRNLFMKILQKRQETLIS